MATILFVHGTGVRRAAYDQTFALLADALRQHDIGPRLDRCTWGDVLGATRPQRSVPGMGAGAVAVAALQEDERRWALLIDDPFIELRVLAARTDARPLPPGAIAAARDTANAAADRVLDYAVGGSPRATLAAWGLEDIWPAAWAAFTDGAELVRAAFQASSGDIGEPGRDAARAATAYLLLFAADDGHALPRREHRDAFVTALADDMRVLVAGLPGFLKSFFTKAALGVATRAGVAHRAAMSENAGPVAGDILVYQARGAAIRQYVKERVLDAKDDVYLLAHSLGGIACVDLLVEDASLGGKVRGLITVGSQAPLFHEIGALVSLEPGTQSLPEHFPPWLNVYDESDFLSYLGTPVFGDDVKDVRVDSRQPFPLSHGAYWSNPETWAAIKEFLQ
jgi:hypothetical protein